MTTLLFTLRINISELKRSEDEKILSTLNFKQGSQAFVYKKLVLYGLMVDSSQVIFLKTSKSRDTKTRPNIKNRAQTNLDIVP